MRFFKYFLFALMFQAAAAGYSYPSQDRSVDAYKKAADQFHKIKSSPKRSARGDWEKSLARFRQVYAKYPRGSKAPQALYMTGTIYSELYKRYKKKLDKDNAITIYRVFVRSYPNSSLADDALYDSGELHLLENKRQEALSDFRAVLRWYPKSDSAPKARGMVARLEKETGRSKPVEKKVVTEGESQDLKGVRYWGNSGYTRVVFEVGKSVHYRASGSAEGDGLTVDLLEMENAVEKPKLIKPLEIFVKSIQVSKLNNEILRVMIRLNSRGTFSTFALSNPERIVVDINVAKPQASAVSQPAQKAEVAAPADRAEKRGPSYHIPSPDASLPMIEPLPSVPPVVPKSDSAAEADQKIRVVPPKEEQEASLAPNAKPEKIRTIVIDPGHGGKDPGAIGRNGLKEKDVTLDVALRLKKQIQSDCRCRVLLTRSTDVFIPLDERTAFANTEEADLFISIHVNSNRTKTAKGVETYFLSPARSKNESYVAARENMIQQENDNEDMNDLAFILFDMQNTDKINESSRMAGTIQRSLAGKLGSTYRIKDNGVKQAMFYVLHGAKMPSILVETSFISNPMEEKLLRSGEYKDTIALGIARGVSEYAKETRMAWYFE